MLPLFQEALRRNPDETRHLSDCGKCMETIDLSTRVYMRCGYEPAAPAHIVTQPYRPPGFKPRDEKHDEPFVCPGYTTSLPEVLETSFARMHYKNNALGAWLAGDDVHEQQLRAIELLECASNECEHLRMTPAKEGGLGK